MTTEFLPSGRDGTLQASLAELASVRLLHSVVTDEGLKIQESAEGTVVGRWAQGLAYEVEFRTGLAIVPSRQLEAALSHRSASLFHISDFKLTNYLLDLNHNIGAPKAKFSWPEGSPKAVFRF